MVNEVSWKTNQYAHTPGLPAQGFVHKLALQGGFQGAGEVPGQFGSLDWKIILRLKWSDCHEAG